jgi:hypothetical protein
MIFAFAALAVALAIQPSQAPPEERVAKSQGAKNTSTTENTNSTQKPSQPHPQAPPTSSQPSTHTNQSNGNSEAENVQVQRWIEVFTGVLACVGVLQLVVMFLTWRVYSRQAHLMEGSIHADGVRIIEFQESKHPVFFVKLLNSGMVAAQKVLISIEVGVDGGWATKYTNDWKITIPAHGSRECPIRAHKALGQGFLPELEKGNLTLRVRCRITKGKKKPVEYCYKYYAWPFGNRPSESKLPLFVPCDFDTQIAGSDIARPAGVSAVVLSVGKITARADNPTTDSPKEPGDPN